MNLAVADAAGSFEQADALSAAARQLGALAGALAVALAAMEERYPATSA